MPGNRFALTVRVRCKIYMVRIFGGFPQFCKKLAFSPDRDVLRLIVIFRVDAHLASRKIAHMAHRRFYVISGSKEFFDSLDLRRGLDDNKIFCQFRNLLCGIGSSGFPR